jgi:drug/metabolite transporter (DMT)-like permease
MAGFGLLHFVIGRYCNVRANQLAGVNLTAPVVQLQVIVTLILAVTLLHEPCSALQIIGGVLILAGSLITQWQPPRPPVAPSAFKSSEDATVPLQSALIKAPAATLFAPRYIAGYLIASVAAVAYGTSTVMARFALEHTGPATGILGGFIAYAAATAIAALGLFWRPIRRDIGTIRRENARLFMVSGILIAAAQGFFFAAISIAPVLLVMPLLQTALAFRLLFSTWLNPAHEVFGGFILAGVVISISGALMVSVDTGLILDTLAIPETIAVLLRWRI